MTMMMQRKGQKQPSTPGVSQQGSLLNRRKKGKRNHHEVLILVLVVGVFLLVSLSGLGYLFYLLDPTTRTVPAGGGGGRDTTSGHAGSTARMTADAAQQAPKVPILPIFAPIPNAEQLMHDTLNNRKPTMAGIVAILQKFVAEVHMANAQRLKQANAMEIVKTIFDLTSQHLGRFDQAYRDDKTKQEMPIFPIRNDESIFLSLAAFREELLADTLRFAFAQAKHPDELYVGAVLQNCFGRVLEDGVTIDTSGLPCKTGAQVIGKNEKGRDMTKVSDAPPDKNGIEDFCGMSSSGEYKKYCDNGQIRVLYVHESESMGPAMARYYASKLWGGETYFVQTDSHLMFAHEWDEKYRLEIQAAMSYPKAVLSSYPPGFPAAADHDPDHAVVPETPGARLCVCSTVLEDPNPIVRINTGQGYRGNEPRPTQIPFIAAGFFFTRAEFLVDVPFDPYMPFLFMGEEIALSMRAWTHGWDIYAPRTNLIAHQYRPGRMGLPKFWGSVNRLYKPGAGNNVIQAIVIKRIKHMVGYPDASLENINAQGIGFVLKDIEHYGIGSVRSWQEYMEFAHMSIDKEHDVIVCSRNEWCNQGLKD
jgi:Glycosyltransferase (GlcNAc)